LYMCTKVIAKDLIPREVPHLKN